MSVLEQEWKIFPDGLVKMEDMFTSESSNCSSKYLRFDMHLNMVQRDGCGPQIWKKHFPELVLILWKNT